MNYRFWNKKPLQRRISLAPYGAPNFYVDEFINPEWYHRGMSDDNLIQMVVNSKLHLLAQFLRNFYNCPIIINTWARRGIGGRVDSGLRLPNSVGAALSYHKLFGCIDYKVLKNRSWLSGKEMFEDIMNDKELRTILIEDFGLRELEFHTSKSGKMRYWQHASLIGKNNGRIKVLMV